MFRHSNDALESMRKGNTDCAELFTDPEIEKQQLDVTELAGNGLARCVMSYRHNDGKNSRGEHSPSFA